jgi:hypothetical protein
MIKTKVDDSGSVGACPGLARIGARSHWRKPNQVRWMARKIGGHRAALSDIRQPCWNRLQPTGIGQRASLVTGACRGRGSKQLGEDARRAPIKPQTQTFAGKQLVCDDERRAPQPGLVAERRSSDAQVSSRQRKGSPVDRLPDAGQNEVACDAAADRPRGGPKAGDVPT